ncbi:hypothetical protein Ciccas_010211, partial [Cichlidogyrus casuarinus]
MHLACMRADAQIVSALLMHHPRLSKKNIFGWTPMAEAISTGSRSIVSRMLRYELEYEQEYQPEEISSMLSNIQDFAVQFTWKISSWDQVLHSEIVSTSISANNIECEHSTRKINMGLYSGQSFQVKSLKLSMKKRYEHMTAHDLDRNKRIKTAFLHSFARKHSLKPIYSQKGSASEERMEARYEDGLPVSWEEYSSWGMQEEELHMGRVRKMRSKMKSVQFSAVMCPEIPFSLNHLMDLMQLLLPSKRFRKFKSTLLHRLPPGFPIRF